MVTNGKELKQKILKDFRSIADFARKSDCDYSYMQLTLNGLHVYREAITALERHGYRPVMKARRKKAS